MGVLKARVGGIWVPVGAGQDEQAQAYRHIQTTPATVWNIDHGLSFYPHVTVVDSSHREVFPDHIDFPSATTVVVTFTASVGGEAYLS
jgi:2'-5' RNA ligase